ncbi:MAG: hypothetical protein D6753_10215 [Planctomycetota bacterium]|nr:MAG: hypothetical protein D6753_10215 [Planctomycetota bacterium]
MLRHRMNRCFWTICRWLLGFRYRTRLEGAERLRNLRGPTLVLPNHPAYIDPPLVSSHIRLHRPLRPLVFSGTYRMLPLRPLMWLVSAFEVPDLSSHSRRAAAQAREMIDAVVDRLHDGDCLLIYPSGRLQRGDREVVGAARAVHEIVSRCPEVNIVLVRTRGVWGSMFSCAETAAPPPLGRRTLQAVGWVLASLFFFLPRRTVRMQVEVVPRDRLPLESREEFNAFLEQWYNADGGEAPRFVPYHHWFGPRSKTYGGNASHRTYEVASIDPATISLVTQLIESHLGRELDPAEQQAATPLESLGLDSLDRMDLALKIEHQFGFRSDDVARTLGDLWALADGKLASDAATKAASLRPPKLWMRTRPPVPATVLSDTIADAFVRRCLTSGGAPAVADAVSGVLTYRRLLVASLLMARRFGELSQPRIGILLPASAAADIAFFAAHLSGKTPVMLNWTTGPSNLQHAVETTGLRQIITSRKVVDRLGVAAPPTAEFLFLEDIKASIGRGEALVTLLQTWFLPHRIRRIVPPQEPDEPAVFLFTSGSESRPKTVPLSHRNLITNVRDGLEILEADTQDAVLGFLPPFHSFGLTGNVVLPVLAGIRCIHHPDPTDAAGLVRLTAAFRPTLLFATPTFLSYMCAAAEDDALKSLRIVVTGAEKCPESVFDACATKAPQATILEGYGITECSPVVAANRRDDHRRGSIGKPVRHVQIAIVDLDSNQPVPPGQTGMLLVRGPSVFSGYFQYDGPSPMVEFQGQEWYRTGDLVSMDADGFLHFQGRLKRFLKAGGEMISLPALESPLAAAFPPDEQGPRVAVEGVETERGRHIVLFTTTDLTLRQANQLLIQAGLQGVLRLDEVRRIPSIPVLGTGKTDYKSLRDLIPRDQSSGSPAPA